MEDYAFHIFSLVLCMLCMGFGIPGNCLILRVYWVKPRKTSTHILILGLAWVDLAVCVSLTLRIVSYVTILSGGRVGQALTLLHFFLQTAVASSVTLTAVIAFDRYDCVCRPRRRLLSAARAQLASCCSVVYSAAINVPFVVNVYRSSGASTAALFSFQILCYVSALTMIVLCYSRVYVTVRRHVRVGVAASASVHRGSRRPSLRCESSGPAATPWQHRRGLEMTSVSRSVAGPDPSSREPAGPGRSGAEPEPAAAETARVESAGIAARGSRRTSCAPATGNSRRDSRQDPRAGGASSLQRRTTRMLLLTSVVFLIAWLPYWIWVMLSLLDSYSAWDIPQSVLRALTRLNASLYINNAINPLLYGLANRRFRQDCKDVVKKMF